MRRHNFFSALLVVSLTVGCGVEPETLDSLRAAVETISSDGSGLTSGLTSGLPQGDGTENDLNTSSGLADAFQPPHPDRVDAFSFTAGVEFNGQGSVETSVANVVVIGFANVREPRVFLRIEDQTRSLRVGEVANGIEVVAIREPVVELRMGSLLWTATMFDSASRVQD